jgi:hypothetical protein
MPIPHDRRVRAEFLSFLPQLKRVFRAKFRRQRCHDRHDSISEAIAFGFAMWLSLRAKGKRVGPYALARYAALTVQAGRRFAGYTSHDCFSQAVRPRLLHMGALDPAHLESLLAQRRSRWPVLEHVRFKLDWLDFLKGQPQPTQWAIEGLSRGYRRCEVARMLGISPSSVTAWMERAYQAWCRYDGLAEKRSA